MVDIQARTPDAGSVLIDGWLFPLVGGVFNIQNMNSFQRKNVVGDYQRDSNPILSGWIGYDLTAGTGILSLEEGADIGKYNFGVIDARRPRQITLPPLTVAYTGTAGSFYPLGMIGGDFYGVFGADMHVWDEDTDAFTDTGDNLSGTPTQIGTPFKGKLFIPLGEDGYDTWDGTTVVNDPAHLAQAFCIIGARMVMVTTDGYLQHTVDGTTWSDASEEARIDASFVVRSIIQYKDNDQFPMPMIVTDQGMFAYDIAGPTIYRAGDTSQPPHQSFGLGATQFGGDLFMSLAMGVARYNGSVQAPMGLDGGQGLPTEIRGKIVSLMGGYNEMYALVSGAAGAGDDIEEWVFDEGNDDWYVSPASVVSSLHIWTTYGWHCYWTSGDAEGTPTFLHTSAIQTSDTDSTLRVWWGIGESAMSMEIPFDFANGRALIESGTGRFAETGYILTGGFDAGMVGQTKIANTVAVRAKNCSATKTIRVSYRIVETDGPWVFLDYVTDNGLTVIQFGELDGIFGQVYEGVPFQEIELRFDFTRDPDDVSGSPILESWAFSFLKVMPPFKSFAGSIDLTKPFNGKSPVQMADKLDELQASYRFLTCVYNQNMYRVRIAAGGGNAFSGKSDDRFNQTYNLISISQTL